MRRSVLLVFGAGGHGKVVADVLLASGERIDGFIDDHAAPGASVLGLPIVGGMDWLDDDDAKDASIALGIGDNSLRERIAEACIAKGVTLRKAVHPKATIAASAVIGEGAVIMAHAVVNPDARIGRGAIVNTGAIVEHDCVVGAFAHLSPRSVMGGGCHVGHAAHLGIGATMLPRMTVGARAIVGGGAVVTRPVPASVVAAGVPARVTRSLDPRSGP